MQAWGRLVTAVIAAVMLGLGVGVVFADRSDPPSLPGPIVIDPVGSTTDAPSLTCPSPGIQEPMVEPVTPRVIDDDDGGDDDGDDD